MIPGGTSGDQSPNCESDLYIDGITCCDQTTAHDLARYRLIHPMRLGAIGQRVPPGLTAAGHAMLAAVPADAGQSRRTVDTYRAAPP